MKRIAAAFAAILCAAACRQAPELPEAPREMPMREVTIVISGGGLPAAGTRSSVTAPEDGIRSVNIFFYSDDNLESSLTQSMSFSGDGVNTCSRTVNLYAGKNYEVLVIANGGSVNPPSRLEDAIASLSYETTGFARWSREGLPMAGRKRFCVSPSSRVVEVALVRLVAKVNFTVRTSSLKHGSIKFNSIAVRQMNTCCPYFSDGAAETQCCDGDLASAADLQRINSSPEGYSTSFYLLENLQGDILSGNKDPDAKIPENVEDVGGDPGLCTYLELKGSYSGSSGQLKSESLQARLFLGEDACENFDIMRNRQYNIDLTITDEGCLRTDWKIDAHLRDTRELRFNSASATLEAGEDEEIELLTNLSWAAGDYSYVIAGDLMCFDVDVSSDATTFNVSSLSSAPQGARLEITASSWDGRLVSKHTAVVSGGGTSNYEINWRSGSGVIYIAQRGYIDIKDKSTGAYPRGNVSVSSTAGVADINRSGNEWYADALKEGEDEIIVKVDGRVVARLPFIAAAPLLTFPSDRIFLPLDGAVVDCGPTYRRIDGTVLNYSDFVPELYEELLDIAVERNMESSMSGRWWTRSYTVGNPIVNSMNMSSTHTHFGFYIAALSAQGHGISENYSMQSGAVTLERITAYPNDRECGVQPVSAELYTSEPFTGSKHLGERESWALCRWSASNSHDEVYSFVINNMIHPGNDYQCATAVYPFSSENKYSFRYLNGRTLEMTILYADNKETAMPEHYFSFAPSMRNRHSGEEYVSDYRYSVDFTVNLSMGGVARANNAGGCDISVEWTFPRLDEGRLRFIEDNVVTAISDRGIVTKGMYTQLYTIHGYSQGYVHENYLPEYSFADLSLAPGTVRPLSGDSYHVALEYGNGYDLVLWKLDSVYPDTNGWLDR